MSPALNLHYAEFYITNVCNLACEGCNRFNNFKINGWQPWHDWEPTYTTWAQQLNIGNIAILGGEPLLNPDIYLWTQNLSRLWPRSTVMIVTNGTQLDKHKQLYDLMTKNHRIVLEVSLHNKMHKKKILEKVKNFLVGPYEYEVDSTKYRESVTIKDSNNIKIKILYDWWFHQGAIKKIDVPGKFALYDSNPVKAHDICHSKTCHHFENGRLYKCGQSSLFRTFDKQIGLELSDEDRSIMESVRSIGIEDDLDVKKQFIGGLNEPIPQCKFCPEQYEGKMIFSLEKKDL